MASPTRTQKLVTVSGRGPAARVGRRLQAIIGPSLAYLLLGGGGVLMVVPFAWMATTALKSEAQTYIFPPIWIPDPILWENFRIVWDAAPFGRFILNSLVVAIAITTGQMILASTAAYAFARLRFPFRSQLFLLYLAMMMIPYHVQLVPLFILVGKLGWMDTYQGIVLPSLFSAYATFLLRQFFMTIPSELEEAAKVDGASYFRIYWQIVLPLSKPALATLSVFVFLFAWNDFLWPLIVINSLEMKTIPLGLSFFLGQYRIFWNYLMVGATLGILPVLLLFFFTQRYFVRGITLTGIKA